MKNYENLKSFNFYQHIKEIQQHNMSTPYFLADDSMYKNLGISFPLRNFSYGIGITYSGDTGNVKIGSADYELKAGSLTTIGPGIVSLWQPYVEAKHDTLYFTEDLLTNMSKNSFLQSLSFFFPGGQHVLQVSDEKLQEFKMLFDTMRSFRYNEQLMPGLVYSLLVLAQECHQNTPAKLKNTTPQEIVIGNFRKLLTAHVLEQKDVNFYADRLNITPKYLSEILLKQTGKPTKKWIEEHLAMEAKSLLRQTSMTVQEICYWLGYEDTSYFIKAFKKWTGITPAAYRSL